MNEAELYGGAHQRQTGSSFIPTSLGIHAGSPNKEVELLAGRPDVVQRLQNIVIERGRNPIIYDQRGVEKTSLATVP